MSAIRQKQTFVVSGRTCLSDKPDSKIKLRAVFEALPKNEYRMPPTSKDAKMKLSLMQMRLAILSIHDCEAKDCIEVVKVKADQGGVSNVLDVCTFEIQGHPTASKCFSWSVRENPSLIMISAVLMTPDVKTASDAVKYNQKRLEQA